MESIGRDHPRVCGEKYDRAWCADMKEGSPPRMRGKGYIQNLKGRGLRITPAYAGKSTPT